MEFAGKKQTSPVKPRKTSATVYLLQDSKLAFKEAALVETGTKA